MNSSSSFAITIVLFALESFGQPSLYPSTLKMEVGDRVYICGKNLIPGERIQVSYKQSADIYFADQHGNLSGDITKLPTSATVSSNFYATFIACSSSSGLCTNFTVECAPESKEIAPSIIKEIWVDRFYVGRDQVTIKADIAVGQLTKALQASSPGGPWQAVGDPMMLWIDDFGREVYFMFSIDRNPGAFFKLVTVP